MSELWSTVLLAALGGAGVGLVAGFISAIVSLHARRWRNGALMRRGEPPLKDAILPPFHLPGAVLGLPLGGVLGVWLPLPQAIVIGGCAVPALIVVLTIAVTVPQSRSKSTGDRGVGGPPG